MSSVKKTVKVLGAKVKVTKKDAKQVSPLMKYWDMRLNEAFVAGFAVGASGVFIIASIIFGIAI